MNPLDQLKDIHLPGAVSNWPPAYGWWLLSVLILFTLIFSIKASLTFRRKRLAKRQALKELAKLTHSDSDWPVQLNQLLKRLVISYFPQEEVAGLHLDSWCAFLTTQLPIKAQVKFSQQMQALQGYIYRPMGEAPDFISCINQAEVWILHAIPPRRNKIHKKELADV
jgi:hypothetical protein